MSKDKNVVIRAQDALDYHEFPKPGKFEIVPTKPLTSQRDLAMAYSPGVAEPCLKIVDNPLDAYRYTNRRNLVAVITNGTAVLGLGNIGPLASKPVMEGKAVLFKSLAGVDAVDIELDAPDVETFITCVKAMEPTFGGINLEDIAAPACFEIEERLQKMMDIPIFHDDQHGTAIITGAALINALELQKKKIDEVQVVFTGAGAAAIACARFYVSLGVLRENITMIDFHGVIYEGRTEGMNPYMAQFARATEMRTLGEAMVDADVFVGLSAGGIVSKAMVRSMAARPIIFALANPTPEISYDDVQEVRNDAITATGRSDFPNQVNNVLGFPYLFRGALDVNSRGINETMKLAAAHALAALAREEVPDMASEAYGREHISFGPNYIIPRPFDQRVLLRVAPAVARAAVETGYAREPITDFDAYRDQLERFQGISKGLMRRLFNVAKRTPKRILFPEGDEPKILKAAQILVDEGIARPVLIGEESKIRAAAAKIDVDLSGMDIVDNFTDPRTPKLVEKYHQMRQRKGITLAEARSIMKRREPFAMMLVHEGYADGVVSGLTKPYSDSLRPALEIIGVEGKGQRAAGMHIVVTRRGTMLFADTTVNIEPDANTLAEIAIKTADIAVMLDITPKIAMLSFSNFGTSRHPAAERVAEATRIVKRLRPELEIDGEMQLDTALDTELRAENFEFATLEGQANIFIFPDLNSGNIGYKLMSQLGQAEVIGPILLGMRRPINVLQLGSSVSAIVNLATITVLKAQQNLQ